MEPPDPNELRKAFTLTEVMLAVGVVAIVVPLVLALIIAGGDGSRRAESETRSVMTARSVFEEIRLARSDSGEFVSRKDLPWHEALEGSSQSTERSEWLYLRLNQEGNILGQSPEMDYEEGWKGDSNEVSAFASIRGGYVEIDGTLDPAGDPIRIFQLELRIETPARARAKSRERYVFLKTESLS